MANEAIPYYRPGQDITFHNASGATIEGKRFVAVSAARQADGNITAARAGAGVQADGVNTGDVANDGKGAFAREGCYPVTSGAAVVAGDDVESDASGRAIPLAAGKRLGTAVDTVGGANLDVGILLSL